MNDHKTGRQPRESRTSIEPLAVSPQDASTMLGVCLATIYNRMASGELPSTQLGRRRLIPVAAIRQIIDSAN